jgi:SAM-dependent methyltransferase
LIDPGDEEIQDASTLVDYFDRRPSRAFDADARFLVRLLEERRPRLIEFGCGTGRLLRCLARMGFDDLAGVDVVPEMIERGHSQGLPAIRAMVCADVGVVWDATQRASLGPADVVMIGSNMINDLCEPAQKRALLINARNLLTPDGFVIVDWRVPELFRSGVRNVVNQVTASFVDGSGHYVESLVSYECDFWRQTRTGSTTHVVYEREGGRVIRRIHSPLRSAFIKPAELATLAELVGLRVADAWGSYELEPLTDSSTMCIFRLRPDA